MHAKKEELTQANTHSNYLWMQFVAPIRSSCVTGAAVLTSHDCTILYSKYQFVVAAKPNKTQFLSLIATTSTSINWWKLTPDNRHVSDVSLLRTQISTVLKAVDTENKLVFLLLN